MKGVDGVEGDGEVAENGDVRSGVARCGEDMDVGSGATCLQSRDGEFCIVETTTVKSHCRRMAWLR